MLGFKRKPAPTLEDAADKAVARRQNATAVIDVGLHDLLKAEEESDTVVQKAQADIDRLALVHAAARADAAESRAYREAIETVLYGKRS